MGEIVNLRQARKRQARDAAAAGAAENRARFGRTMGQRLADHSDAERRDALLDALRREAALPDGGRRDD
jgi:hypothetical protein